MKKFAYLLSVVALIACSESENVAEVDDVGDLGSSSDVLAEESSSSVDELSSSTGDVPLSTTAQSSATGKTPTSSSLALEGGKSSVAVQSSSSGKSVKSSSSGTVLSSGNENSGNEKQVPSNSNYLDFLDEEISSSFGCGGGVAGGAGAAGGVTGMGIGFSVDSSSLAIFPYTQIIKARTAKLVSNGVAAADAEKKAKEELMAALGLDTLFRENPLQERNARFTRSNVEHALNYFFSLDTVAVASFIKSFSEKGTLDRSEYCGIWNVSLTPGWGQATTDLVYIRARVWASNAAQRGCAATGYEEVPPTYIFSNLYRKCIGLPYCDDKMFGAVQRAGLKNIISDTLYFCNVNGWTFLSSFEEDTKDVPCDKVGKVIESPTVGERYYICKADGWNVATKMDYEVQDIACGDSAKLMKSPTDTSTYYLCKNSKWKIADQMEISTTNVPCDRVGKIVDSGTKDYKGRIFYICRDTGWDAATQREADIGDRTCDAEGKTVQGVVDTNMSYVCYQNSWADFYDAPCDTDNKRVRDWKGGLKEDYICYNGKWSYSRNWSCEFPKEYYFNPNVEYGTLVDDRDGATYRTVEVNGYTWMAENLRYVPSSATQSVVVEEGCEIAGRFYSKEAAKTACPAGWILPDSTVVNSLKKGYDQRPMYLQNSFSQQFVSQIGSLCSSTECNTYGTSFLPLGTSKSPNTKNGPENTRYWAYNSSKTGDVVAFGLSDNNIYLYNIGADDLLTIRCVKE